MTDVSDHAVLRYLERVKGVDVERGRAEMNSPALALADAFGAPVLIGRTGERLVINNGVVVTCIVKPKKARRRVR